VIVEQWADNSVVVSESFDSSMAAKIQSAMRDGSAGAHAANYSQEEIGLRLFDVPAFRAFADRIGAKIAQEIVRNSGR
jgi:hypothetical protein